MSYTPTQWETGDIVTAEKLNKLENGVAAAGSGGALFVNMTEDGDASVLDKTWKEIDDALADGTPVFIMEVETIDVATQRTIHLVSGTISLPQMSLYGVTAGYRESTVEFATNSENGYPSTAEPEPSQ